MEKNQIKKGVTKMISKFDFLGTFEDVMSCESTAEGDSDQINSLTS